MGLNVKPTKNCYKRYNNYRNALYFIINGLKAIRK